MSTGGYWGDVAPGSPRAMRRKSIEEDFIPYVKGIFAKKPALRSALLSVAQFWADEADDAVHATVLFSSRETPLWPHPCRWEIEDEGNDDAQTDPNEMCSSCGEDLGWMSFDDNGENTIAAFQPCCREDASQESTTSEGYLPYAVARRSPTAKDGVDVEIVGGPVRAWLDDEATFPRAIKSRRYDAKTMELFDLVYGTRSNDEARQVLADHLQQKGDSLGEYITLSYALLAETHDDAKRAEIHTRAAELEMRHGRTWLGAIAKAAPAEHVQLDRGFLKAVAVHFADENVAKEVCAAREWGTVQRLRFLPGSEQRLSSKMASLRFVGPLNVYGLEELQRVSESLAIERVHVTLENDEMLKALANLHAPHLRCLIVGALSSAASAVDQLSPKALAPLFRASWWRQLSELVIVSTDGSTVREWLALPVENRPATISFTGLSVAQMTAGFRLRVRGDVATADMPSLNADLTLAGLGAMIEALPRGVRAEVVSSRVYSPTDSDLEELTRAAHRPVTRSTVVTAITE